jgi:hypothetical protein
MVKHPECLTHPMAIHQVKIAMTEAECNEFLSTIISSKVVSITPFVVNEKARLLVIYTKMNYE